MATDRTEGTLQQPSLNSPQTGFNEVQVSTPNLGRAIYKVEEAKIPLEINSFTITLPADVDIDRVIRTVYLNLPHKTLKGKQQWLDIYNSKYCIDMICDFYWLCVAKLIKRAKAVDFESQILERIAMNYVNMFISTPEVNRNAFFLQFADTLAQGVYYALFYSFPKSRSQLIDPDFRKEVFELVASQITGIPISNEPYLNWKIDLGHGNILTDKRSKSTNKLPALKKPKMTKVLDMRYSPIVNRYIKGRHLSRNLVPSCKLKYSKRDILEEIERQEKMDQVKETARTVMKHTSRLSQDYDYYSKNVAKKLDRNRQMLKSMHQILSDRVRSINRHSLLGEYSNYLYSLDINNV